MRWKVAEKKYLILYRREQSEFLLRIFRAHWKSFWTLPFLVIHPN